MITETKPAIVFRLRKHATTSACTSEPKQFSQADAAFFSPSAPPKPPSAPWTPVSPAGPDAQGDGKAVIATPFKRRPARGRPAQPAPLTAPVDVSCTAPAGFDSTLRRLRREWRTSSAGSHQAQKLPGNKLTGRMKRTGPQSGPTLRFRAYKSCFPRWSTPSARPSASSCHCSSTRTSRWPGTDSPWLGACSAADRALPSVRRGRPGPVLQAKANPSIYHESSVPQAPQTAPP